MTAAGRWLPGSRWWRRAAASWRATPPSCARGASGWPAWRAPGPPRGVASEDVEPGRPLELRRDPGNEHDPNAIAVDAAGGGDQLGWVPRELAAELAPLLDEGRLERRCRCARAGPRRATPRTGSPCCWPRPGTIELAGGREREGPIGGRAVRAAARRFHERTQRAREDVCARTGRRDEAAEVKALRKPTAPAWALNQVARRAPGRGQLIDAGRRGRGSGRPGSAAGAALDRARPSRASASSSGSLIGRRRRGREGRGIATAAAFEDKVGATLRAGPPTTRRRPQLVAGRLEGARGGRAVRASTAGRRARPRQPGPEAGRPGAEEAPEEEGR